MEKIGEMALAYYEKNSKEGKEVVQSFFKSMDTDGNGSIGKNEFKSFMDKKSMKFRPELFAELDRDGNGSLDFNEVITFYYMMIVRNLFCDCCEKYLSKEYYTCVKCFLDQSRDKKFIICFSCYRSKKYVGTEHTSLLDNYVMLNSMRSDLDRKNLVEEFGSHAWTSKDITFASIKIAKKAYKANEVVGLGVAVVANHTAIAAAGSAAISAAAGTSAGSAAIAAGSAALSAAAGTSAGSAAIAAGTAAVASGTAAIAAGTAAGTAAIAGGASMGPALVAAGTAVVLTCTIM